MGHNLLLERKVTDRYQVSHRPSNLWKPTVRHTDERTGIKMQCDCHSESGKHEKNCIYNLV